MNVDVSVKGIQSMLVHILVEDGEKVASKKIIARWDPMNRPIIVRQSGKLIIHGNVDGVEIPRMKVLDWLASKSRRTLSIRLCLRSS